MKIEIQLKAEEEEFEDEPNAFICTIKTDMTDQTVHRWFALFERVLRLNGFSDDVIMTGACALAFNEFRDPKSMKKTFDFYELDEFVDQKEKEVIEEIETEV